MATANTIDCLREFVGKKVVGVMHDTFPLGRADLSSGTRTFVFENGSAFTFSRNGSFWSEHKDDVRRAIRELMKKESEMLALAGVSPSETA